MFPIYKATKNANDKKLLETTLYGMTFSLLLYLVVAISGYSAYGQKLTVNFL
jgi:amino acid permease